MQMTMKKLVDLRNVHSKHQCGAADSNLKTTRDDEFECGFSSHSTHYLLIIATRQIHFFFTINISELINVECTQVVRLNSLCLFRFVFFGIIRSVNLRISNIDQISDAFCYQTMTESNLANFGMEVTSYGSRPIRYVLCACMHLFVVDKV